MKSSLLTLTLSAGFASALLGVTSCTADCEDKGTCGAYSPTGGSAGTASGTSGAGGNAGTGGIGGGGAGTSGGAGAGDGGQAADGGTSGTAAAGGRGGSAGGGIGGSGGEAGSSGNDGGAAGGEPSCDPTRSPDEDDCVIDEDQGVFVSPSGDDNAGDGSRENPYATLGKAINKAASSDKRVYACGDGGRYRESVSIGVAAKGIALFGGFSCDDWSYSTSRQSRVTSDEPLALHIDGVDGAHVEDFRFDAADATAPGESSVGVFVANSTDVVLRRVTIAAGAGVDGENGVLEAFSYKDRSELAGKDANGTAGGGEKICECEGDLVTSGGGGGTAQTFGQSGGLGSPDFPGPGGEGGDPTKGCGSGAAGLDGANAPARAAGSAANTPGALTDAGWSPASGADGETGSPGQGGGGGASSSTGGGGGGGCGSCGGAGGPGGQGGGASIALMVYASGVSVEDSMLMSSDAGKGGTGAAGQSAQTESGFGGVQGTGACPGGAGGLGADGAAGGGAAGGISAGILWKGDEPPSQSGVTFTTGTPGSKGIGGEPGMNDGIDGEAGDVLEAS